MALKPRDETERSILNKYINIKVKSLADHVENLSISWLQRNWAKIW